MWQPTVTSRKNIKICIERVLVCLSQSLLFQDKAIFNGVACEHIQFPALFHAAGKSCCETKAGKLSVFAG